MSDVENYQWLSPRTCIVWTQAGFKKASRSMQDENGDEVEGYPKQYPSVVHFISHHKGYHYWYADCTSLNEEIARLENELKVLKELDAEHKAKLEAQCSN